MTAATDPGLVTLICVLAVVIAAYLLIARR